MDTLNIPIIRKCRELSTNIDDYFLQERYLTEVDQNDSATPELLSQIAIDLVLGELSQIGIETSLQMTDIMETCIDRDVMFNLRTKFDKDNFYKEVKALTQQNLSQLNNVIENVSLAEDLLIQIVSFFAAKNELDTSWQSIERSIDYWSSTTNFVSHISAIMDKVNFSTDKNKTPINDYNINDVKQFVMIMQNRNNKIMQFYHNFCKSDIVKQNQNNIDTLILNKLCTRYDKDKLKPDVMIQWAQYIVSNPQYDPQFVIDYKKNHRFFIQYWKQHNQQNPSINDIILMYFTFLLNGFKKQEIDNVIKKYDALPKPAIDLLNNLNVSYEQIVIGDINGTIDE